MVVHEIGEMQRFNSDQQGIDTQYKSYCNSELYEHHVKMHAIFRETKFRYQFRQFLTRSTKSSLLSFSTSHALLNFKSLIFFFPKWNLWNFKFLYR